MKANIGTVNFDGPIDVLDKKGNYIRTYSEEKHGKDYKKLAVSFVNNRLNTPKGEQLVRSKVAGTPAEK